MRVVTATLRFETAAIKVLVEVDGWLDWMMRERKGMSTEGKDDNIMENQGNTSVTLSLVTLSLSLS